SVVLVPEAVSKPHRPAEVRLEVVDEIQFESGGRALDFFRGRSLGLQRIEDAVRRGFQIRERDTRPWRDRQPPLAGVLVRVLTGADRRRELTVLDDGLP